MSVFVRTIKSVSSFRCTISSSRSLSILIVARLAMTHRPRGARHVGDHDAAAVSGGDPSDALSLDLDGASDAGVDSGHSVLLEVPSVRVASMKRYL